MAGIKWSKEEDEILAKLYPNPKVTKEDLLKIFASRTWEAIEKRASKLKLTNLRKGIINYEYLKKLEELIEG